MDKCPRPRGGCFQRGRTPAPHTNPNLRRPRICGRITPARIALFMELRIVAYVKEHGPIRRAEAQKLLEVSNTRAKDMLSKMEKAGLLRLVGQKKGARYLIP